LDGNNHWVVLALFCAIAAIFAIVRYTAIQTSVKAVFGRVCDVVVAGRRGGDGEVPSAAHL
jgi:hypothetical protein